MEKLKKKRIINPKAGSHDLSYVLRERASARIKLDMESLLTSLATRSLPSVLGAADYLGERFFHSDMARDYSCCSMYECKLDLVRVHNIDHYFLGVHG
jgi:hypothetical protein